ncbi:MAG TPA: S8 family serine peptidase [Gemmataceae bacterium]|nr:S8 family serine peptidase [Gemmataceae bacterium]
MIKFTRSRRRQALSKVRPVRVRLDVELLEGRNLLSTGSSALPPNLIVLNANQVHPDIASATPVGFTPAQIKKAYGIDQIKVRGVLQDGTGQTIAIVDAGDNPNFVSRDPNLPLAQDTAFLASDLHGFDKQFGLPEPAGFFTKVNQDGNAAPLPLMDPNFQAEIALDVEWVHALAPGAKIILVEATVVPNDGGFDEPDSDLLDAAAVWAGQHSGATVVSMSFSDNEISSNVSTDFQSPPGYGVTFLGSTGDAGSTGQNSVGSDNGNTGGWPAFSPDVVAVGGTSLFLDAHGNYLSESGWSGSGGGISLFQVKPPYQDNVNNTNNFREAPDVSFDADTATGIAYYDTYTNFPDAPWNEIGGTSFSCPAWAALVAIADEIRAEHGLGSLDGPSQTLPTLYQLADDPTTYANDFHDITTGSNGSGNNTNYSAGVGYDLVTGLGTPIANRLVPDLAGAADVSTVSATTPNGSYAAGRVIAITVNFTGVVDVTGSPLLTLNSGGTAVYAGGSGTHTLTFLYTVAPGENSAHLDYTSASALSLNGGTITYNGGDPLDLTLPGPGTAGSLAADTTIAIDTRAPFVVAARVLFGSQSYNLIGSTRFDLPWRITGVQVVFSEAVVGASAASITGLPITGFSGGGTNTLTWQLSPITLGIFTATLHTGTLTDLAGNHLAGAALLTEQFRVLYGDVLGHGVVDAADLAALSQALRQPYNIFADINGDGLVDSRDLIAAHGWLGQRLPSRPH